MSANSSAPSKKFGESMDFGNDGGGGKGPSMMFQENMDRPGPIKSTKIKQEYPNLNPQKIGIKKKIKIEDDKPRVKRPYVKRQNNDMEKPPPKKRGRKRKQDMDPLACNNGKQGVDFDYDPKNCKSKNKSPLAGKNARNTTKKGAPTRTKTASSLSQNLGPSVFDRKILAGPHLTMKQVLEYILTDHSYCVPPDPLPAVGSNHQMIRYILGPKGGAKARALPTLGMVDTGNNSPLAYSSVTLPRARPQLTLSGTSSPSSKLEQLLKRGGDSLQSMSSPSITLRLGPQRATEAREDSDVEIDVESTEPEPDKRIAYDVQKAKDVMNECEKYVEFARETDTGDEWEAKIVKTGWTKAQSGLFEKVVGALHAERLARLTYSGVGDTEPVLRRASLDRTACRVRRIFGEYLWDTKLTQWLHGIFTESLNFHYLAIYLDVLQTLKACCPQLISRMMKLSVAVPLQNAYGHEDELANLLTPFMESSTTEPLDRPPEEQPTPHDSADMPIVAPDVDNTHSSAGDSAQGASDPLSDEPKAIYLPERSIVPQMTSAMLQLQSAKNAEALKSLLSRQWDPFSSILFQRLKKLSVNPIFVTIAPGAVFPKMSLYRRLKQYYRMFARVGQVVKVQLSSSEIMRMTSTSLYLEKVMQLAREKIKQARHQHPDRPIYLVGWGSGSVLAGRLSVVAGPVDGIIALGFPLHTLKDVHDDILKAYTAIKHPILFVIGGLAANNSLTDMEQFRKRLPCETSLVVIGSGNENLYVSREHREKLLVTQSYVDKTVMDEVAYFVNLHSKHNQVILPNFNAMRQSHYPKYPGNDTTPLGKSVGGVGLLRGKKRKNMPGMDAGPPRRMSESNPMGSTGYPSLASPFPSPPIGTPKPSYEYPDISSNYAPMNRTGTGNKRKSSLTMRTESPLPMQASTSANGTITPNYVTASQMLQTQGGAANSKKKSTKPSPSVHRPTLLNQPSSGIRPIADSMENQTALNTPPTSVGTVSYSFNVEKPAKKKAPRTKTATKGPSSSCSIASTINEVASLPPPPVDPLSSDFNQYNVLQQQEMKDMATAPTTVDVILPADSDAPVFAPGANAVAGISSSSEGTTGTKLPTAFISRQNLLYGMKFPFITLTSAAASGALGQSTTLPTSVNVSSPTLIGGEIIGNPATLDDEGKIILSDPMNPGGLQLVSLGIPPTSFVDESQDSSDATTTVTLNPMAIAMSEASIIVSQEEGSNSTEPAFIGPDPEPVESIDAVVSASEPEQFLPGDSGETNVEQDSMDVDDDEEMSGLKISSTFSVCPTSGERVDLQTESQLTTDETQESKDESAASQDVLSSIETKHEPIVATQKEKAAPKTTSSSEDMAKATADAISSVINAVRKSISKAATSSVSSSSPVIPSMAPSETISKKEAHAIGDESGKLVKTGIGKASPHPKPKASRRKSLPSSSKPDPKTDPLKIEDSPGKKDKGLKVKKNAKDTPPAEQTTVAGAKIDDSTKSDKGSNVPLKVKKKVKETTSSEQAAVAPDAKIVDSPTKSDKVSDAPVKVKKKKKVKEDPLAEQSPPASTSTSTGKNSPISAKSTFLQIAEKVATEKGKLNVNKTGVLKDTTEAPNKSVKAESSGKQQPKQNTATAAPEKKRKPKVTQNVKPTKLEDEIKSTEESTGENQEKLASESKDRVTETQSIPPPSIPSKSTTKSSKPASASTETKAKAGPSKRKMSKDEEESILADPEVEEKKVKLSTPDEAEDHKSPAQESTSFTEEGNADEDSDEKTKTPMRRSARLKSGF